MSPRAPLVSACLAALLVVGCAGSSGTDDGPGPVTAPTSVEVDGQSIVVSPYAWRDQMPSVGDEPGPCSSLCVNGTVELASGDALPEDLEVLEVVAIVDGEQAPFEEVELRGRLGPSGYEFIARRGPTLETGTSFDLAVKVAVGGSERWLRSEGVVVQRTA